MQTPLYRARRIISELMDRDIEAIGENTRLREDLGLDSLDVVEVEMALEEEFAVFFDPLSDDDELLANGTLTEILARIELRRSEQRGESRP